LLPGSKSSYFSGTPCPREEGENNERLMRVYDSNRRVSCAVRHRGSFVRSLRPPIPDIDGKSDRLETKDDSDNMYQVRCNRRASALQQSGNETASVPLLQPLQRQACGVAASENYSATSRSSCAGRSGLSRVLRSSPLVPFSRRSRSSLSSRSFISRSRSRSGLRERSRGSRRSRS